jgi:hypothetical protein
MLIPMMSLLFNTEDQKLYLPKEHTLVNPETGNIQDIPPAEWIPSEKPISDDTFHLVAKTYMVAFPTLDPNRYENSLYFPTRETLNRVLEFFRSILPSNGGYTLDVSGNPDNPRDYQDRVYVTVTRWKGEDNQKSGQYAAGYVALGISQGGAESMRERQLAEMRENGLL